MNPSRRPKVTLTYSASVRSRVETNRKNKQETHLVSRVVAVGPPSQGCPNSRAAALAPLEVDELLGEEDAGFGSVLPEVLELSRTAAVEAVARSEDCRDVLDLGERSDENSSSACWRGVR